MFVDLEFGNGTVVVGRAELNGRHGVVISPARTHGQVGENAESEMPLAGGIILWFKTEEHARKVRAALLGDTEPVSEAEGNLAHWRTAYDTDLARGRSPSEFGMQWMSEQISIWTEAVKTEKKD